MRAMQRTPRSRQRGLSFIGLVLWGFIIVAGVAVGSQAVPVVIENMNIKKAATRAARQGSTVQEVRDIYQKAQAIDDMKSVNAKDLDVTKDSNGSIVVSYSYERDVPLFGPAYLVFRFKDSVK
ncbi:DUF4845 domain-containing protein [Comamonas sp. J-3]|uniref:DUF4845 domain-containing protein n=1 Tax=Comamonas trifloxystrobinivorans TaxID=3350256 RepID=UPI00372C7414